MPIHNVWGADCGEVIPKCKSANVGEKKQREKLFGFNLDFNTSQDNQKLRFPLKVSENSFGTHLVRYTLKLY